MSKPILEVENISKLNNLYQTKSSSLYEVSTYYFNRLRGKNGPKTWKIKRNLRVDIPHEMGPKPNTFWALKDVSFTLDRGEVLTVFGENGAGKTTLMKILSKIKPPTAGRVILRGKVFSTLSKGVGFHEELSGRQNIYLNGAILGVRKKEIDARLDQIIDFAEIGGFIDSPIKFYSSGMQMRLGFATATHFSPDIMVLDESLTVGDNYFQQKSFERLKNIRMNGCAVIFVTHQAFRTERLSPVARGILLKAGKIIKMGTALEVSEAYFKESDRA